MTKSSKFWATFITRPICWYQGKTAKYRRDQFLCQVWQRSPCSLSLKLNGNLKTQVLLVLLDQLPYLANVYNGLHSFSRIFSNISSQSLEDSIMNFGDKHFRHLANNDRSGLFSTAWLQRLATKNSNASFLNWKPCLLVTFLLLAFSIRILYQTPNRHYWYPFDLFYQLRLALSVYGCFSTLKHIFPDKLRTQWPKKSLKTLCKKGEQRLISLV